MKVLLSKFLVLRDARLSLITFLCCSVGFVLIWNLKDSKETTPNIITEPYHSTFDVSEQHDADVSGNCVIEGSHDGMELRDAELIGARFSNAKFNNAHVINSEFRRADFKSADWSGATIFYSNFSESNFAEANLSRSKIHGSDFTDADLSNTNLFRAYLVHSDFTNANLKYANLEDANLGDANLRTAIGLTYNQIEKAVINKFTTLPQNLESKKEMLLKKSLQTEKRLKQQLPISDYDNWKHPFFNLD